MPRFKFESASQQGYVLNTLTRLLQDINERSHSTAETQNLRLAIKCVLDAEVEGEFS